MSTVALVYIAYGSYKGVKNTGTYQNTRTGICALLTYVILNSECLFPHL